MTSVVNINEVLDDHVRLSVECVDRILLNAYVPKLQSSGQVAYFMRDHLEMPIPSPATLEKIGNRFRREVRAFAAANRVPVLGLAKPDRSRWDDRKLDHVRPHFERAEREGRFGAVAIVATQATPSSSPPRTGRRRRGSPGSTSCVSSDESASTTS